MATDEAGGPSLLLLLAVLAAALNHGVFYEVLGLALAMSGLCLLSLALLFPLVSVPDAGSKLVP